MNRIIYVLSFAILFFTGMSTAFARGCTEDIPVLQAAIDRAAHVNAESQAEQRDALAHGAMRKSTGRDAMEVYDAMTSQVATSGQDAARQSAGKPTVYQEAAEHRAARIAKAQAALTRAYAHDAAMDDKGCRAAVAEAKHLLLGG